MKYSKHLFNINFWLRRVILFFLLLPLTDICLTKENSLNNFDFLNTIEQLISLEGTGYALPLNNHPITKVKVFEKSSGKLLDSTFTDQDGFYRIDFLTTNINNPFEDPISPRLLKNPFDERLTVQYNIKQEGKYDLIINDITGLILLRQNIFLNIGNNEITVTGLGNSGIKIITLSNNIKKESIKAIQTSSKPFNPKVLISNLIDKKKSSFNEQSLRKSSLASDSIRITFESLNYFIIDTIVELKSSLTVDYILKQKPLAIHNFWIKPKTIHGDNIANLTLDFKWADGTTKQYGVQPDGFIHINRTEYTNPTTTAIVTHVSDTAKYSTWQIFRLPPEQHSLADTNYAQNQKLTTEYLPRAGTLLRLDNIPDTLFLYLPPTKVKTPESLVATYGDSVRLDNHVILNMMGGRGPPLASTKFVPRLGAENVYVFQMTFNQTTGLPVAQIELDRAKTELDKVLAIYTLNDGTKLLNYEFSTINSYTDPKWLESVARDYDNKARTTFDNSSPYNGLALTLTYSINNKARIKNSFSIYGTGSTQGQICEEIYQQFTNNQDPIQNTAPWVYTATEITEFGKTMARLLIMFNQGTTTTKIY